MNISVVIHRKSIIGKKTSKRQIHWETWIQNSSSFTPIVESPISAAALAASSSLRCLLFLWIYAVKNCRFWQSEPLNDCKEILSCCSFMFSRFQHFVPFGFGGSNNLCVWCFDEIVLERLLVIWRQPPVSCHLLIFSAGYLTDALLLTWRQLVSSDPSFLGSFFTIFLSETTSFSFPLSFPFLTSSFIVSAFFCPLFWRHSTNVAQLCILK